MAPITMPVFFAGIITCVLIEKFSIAGFGNQLPSNIRGIFNDYAVYRNENITSKDKAELFIEIIVALFLVVALALHLAAVGLIGLSVIILLTAFKGITEEHKLGEAFHEALPFTALLAVFFAIVSVIHDQHLFTPVINYVLAQDPSKAVNKIITLRPIRPTAARCRAKATTKNNATIISIKSSALSFEVIFSFL
jgi:NhaB family Na+:H+ antiporter